MKKEKAITLISLVITIILLLILANISITLAFGEHGIFRIAQKAKEEYEKGQEDEEQSLEDLYSEILIATNDSAKITISAQKLEELIDLSVEKKLAEQGRMEKYIEKETLIGEWIDGKPIYRNIIKFNMQASTDFVIDAPWNMDSLVDLRGFISNGEALTPLTAITESNNHAMIHKLNSNQLRVLKDSAGAWNGSDAYAIVEYTKTTDVAKK